MHRKTSHCNQSRQASVSQDKNLHSLFCSLQLRADPLTRSFRLLPPAVTIHSRRAHLPPWAPTIRPWRNAMPPTAPSAAPVQAPSHPTKLLPGLKDVTEDLSFPAAAADTSCVSAADTSARSSRTSHRFQKTRISKRLPGAFILRGRSPSSFRLRLPPLSLLIPLVLLRELVLRRWVLRRQVQEVAASSRIISCHLIQQRIVLHHALRRNISLHRTLSQRLLPHKMLLHHILPRHTLAHHTLPRQILPQHTIPHKMLQHHTLPRHTRPHHILPRHTIHIAQHPVLLWRHMLPRHFSARPSISHKLPPRPQLTYAPFQSHISNLPIC